LSLVTIVLLLASSSAIARTESPEIKTAPPPAWIEQAAGIDELQIPEDAQQRGEYYLMLDEQIRISDRHKERYMRIAKKVLTTSGLQTATEVDIDFDPSYQQLTLHHINLLREERIIDVLRPDEIRVLQREEGLDSQIYDETLTALLFLKDLRIGDTIDYAYTLTGANPVLDGHFADKAVMQFALPVGFLRYRLVFPAHKRLRYQGHNFGDKPDITQSGTSTIWQWQRHEVDAYIGEDHVPSWYDDRVWLQITDFQSWSEVVTWALPLYNPPKGSLGEVNQACREDGMSRDEQALCTIRFVQDQIRYLGLEVGPSSHKPHPPFQVYERRFGDCKDKSLLLISLLSEIGVPARPALVDTDTKRGLDSWLPSPFAFNHVIVRIDFEPEPVWVDATNSLQGGVLHEMVVPAFERALVIAEQSTGLVEIPRSRPYSTRQISEVFRVDGNGNSAELEVCTKYIGEEADSIRSWVANRSLTEIGRSYLNYYAQTFPEIEMIAPLDVSDDRNENQVTIRERYHLPQYWDDDGQYLPAFAISDRLEEPRARIRKLPLAIEHPTDVRHTVTIHGQQKPIVTEIDEEIRVDAFQLSATTTRKGRSVTVEWHYETLREVVEASQVVEHLKAIDDTKELLGLHHSKPRGPEKPAIGSWSTKTLIGIVFLVFIVAAAGVHRYYFGPGRQSRQRSAYVAGETPAKPLSFPSEMVARNHFRSSKCGCGGRFDQESEIHDTLSYDGTTVIGIAQKCTACNAVITNYYKIT
jgi:hypothetical protein